MTLPQKRRFIAGASCPECQAIDTLFVLAGALNDAVECAACGHRQEAPPNKSKAELSPESQVEPLVEPEVEAVKFVDVGKT